MPLLIVLGLVVFQFQIVVVFQLKIDIKAKYADQSKQHRSSATPVMLALSASCNSSRTAVITQNITSAPPIGSRHNGLSLLASEIETISHIPSKRQITIKLRGGDSRICARPFVVGRLSGPYVSLIDKWTPIYVSNITTTDQNEREVVDQLVAEYNVPSTGRYFLEIIGLLCNDLRWDDEYKDVCLEDHAYMRITGDSTYINVDTVITPNDSSNRSNIGYWKWFGNTSTSGLNSGDSDQHTPLLTRYQPPGCRGASEGACQLPMSLDRFKPYQFQFLRDNESARVRSRAFAISSNASNGQTHLCFVGLSHAREMAQAVNTWLQQWNMSSIVARSYDAQFPRFVNKGFIQHIIIGKRCIKTVIAAGQWSAGRKPPGGKYRNVPPTPFPEYMKEVRDMILALKATQAKGIFLRSIHYNSLGDIKLTCPPQDWRHPPVIDRYNVIIRNLTRAFNISFIDTSQIISPMWDSAGDYCHYRNDKVSSAEALYVLGRLI